MSWPRVLKQGAVAGLIGFATVALLLAIVNVIGGHSPVSTASALGAALHGVSDPAMAPIAIGYIVTYTAVHLAVFISLGVFAAALATLADRGWQLWFVSLFFFLFVSFHLYAAVQTLGAPMRSVLPDVLVWVVGVAASLMMALYLLRVHPRLRAAQQW